jgi:Holliday junction resolvase RusA-like endonuclease
MKFIIEGELTDLNKFIKANNASRHASNDIKQDETERVVSEITWQRVEEVDEYPVTITFRWYSKDAMKDIDNVAFAKKFVLDGMVRAGIIENDSRKYVAGFSDQFFIDRKRPRIEVEIHTLSTSTDCKIERNKIQ